MAATAAESAGIRTRIIRRVPIGPDPWPAKPKASVTAAEVIDWLREYVPSSELKILGWYREVIGALYGKPRPLQGIVSIPRGNGKTTLAAALSVYELFGRGRRGTQVLQLATAQRQAALCYEQATAMIDASPPLRSRSRERWVGGYKEREVPALRAFMTPLPSQRERVLSGYTPAFTVVDEIGFATEGVWSAMVHGAAKVRGAQVLGIGTPGNDPSGLMYRLRAYAREHSDPGLYYREWLAPDGCEITDRAAWRVANPGMPVVKSAANMAAVVGTSREEDFRALELGQWVRHGTSWLPWGAWDSLPRCEQPDEGAEVVLGFDGSSSLDSTAIAWACDGAVGLVQAWERPGEARATRPGGPVWKVPHEEVMDVIRWCFKRWQVRAFVADPWRWQQALYDLAHEFGDERVVTFPTNSVSRMAPAVERLSESVLRGEIRHDHSPTLSRHINAAASHRTAYGAKLDKPPSGAKIDAAIAAVLAWQELQRGAPAAPVYSERVVW